MNPCDLCGQQVSPGEQSQPRTKPDGTPEHVHDTCLSLGCCGLHMADDFDPRDPPRHQH